MLNSIFVIEDFNDLLAIHHLFDVALFFSQRALLRNHELR